MALTRHLPPCASEENVTLLGIEPIVPIHGSAAIKSTRNLRIHEYEMGRTPEQLSLSLEPNHTHLLLVDSGKEDATAWGGVCAGEPSHPPLESEIERRAGSHQV